MPQSNDEPASVALEVLSSLSASIPQRELASARGLLITRTHRAALGFGIQTGTAVALRRLDGCDDNVVGRQETTSASSPSSSSSPPSSWSAPLVFAVRRASFGVSYGYATVDSVLLLKTDEEARLLAAGAPAFGTEHRFVSSVLDEDEDDDDSVEVEVEGSGLDTEVIRSELAAAAAGAAAASSSGETAAAASASGEAAAAGPPATTTPAAPPPPRAASSSAATLPPARSAVLFSRSSGALVDMSVVAGMLSLDSAAHTALYCPEASSSLNAFSAAATAAAAASAPATAAPSTRPPPPEPEDVLAGKVERPVAFASVYELLEKMEQQGQQQGRGRE